MLKKKPQTRLRGGAPPQGSGGDNGVKHKTIPQQRGGVIPSPQGGGA